MPFISKGAQWEKGETKEFLRCELKLTKHKFLSPDGRVLTHFSVWVPIEPLNKAHKEFSPWTNKPIRLPGEHLSQGAVFDALGDRSVANLQWVVEGTRKDGVLDNIPKLSGYIQTSGSDADWTEVSGVYLMQLKEGTQYICTDKFSYQYFSKGSNPRYICRSYAPDAEAGTFFAVWQEVYRSGFGSGGKVRFTTTVAWGNGISNRGMTLGGSRSESWEVSRAVANTYGDDPALLKSRALDPGTDIGPITQYPSRGSFTNTQYTLQGDTIPPSHVLEKWYSRVNLCRSELPLALTVAEKSSLAQDLIDNINYFDGNLIAWVRDCASIGSSIRSLLDVVGDLSSPKKWASAWLSGRFGDRLQIHDTMELLSALRRSTRTLSRSFELYRSIIRRHGSGQTPYPCKYDLYCSATVALSSGLLGDMENLLAAPYRWDFALSLENVWDLVPFSFVVDWVYDVQSILKTLDAVQETNLLEVKFSYTGNREEVQCPLEDISEGEWTGTISRIWYHRTPDKPLSWLRLKAFSEYWASSVRPVNIMDAGALLVQQLPD